MKKNFSIRWHSRAGQGAITVANFLVDFLATTGLYVQSFPEFGAEKRGAPVVVFNRISETPVDDPAHLIQTDVVVLVDSSLVGAELEYKDVLKNLKEDGILFINTQKSESSNFNKKYSGKIFHLNATGIALDTIKRNIPNVALMGGLTKILELDKDNVEEFLIKNLSKVFPEKLVEKNMECFHRGYAEGIAV